MENGNGCRSPEEPKDLKDDNGTYALDILGNVFAYSKSNGGKLINIMDMFWLMTREKLLSFINR